MWVGPVGKCFLLEVFLINCWIQTIKRNDDEDDNDDLGLIVLLSQRIFSICNLGHLPPSHTTIMIMIIKIDKLEYGDVIRTLYTLWAYGVPLMQALIISTGGSPMALEHLGLQVFGQLPEGELIYMLASYAKSFQQR